MFRRKVVTVSTVAIAAAAFSVPLAQAQDGQAATGSLDVGSLELGSLEGGSLESASGGEGSSGSVEGEAGSSGSAGDEDGSLAALGAESDPTAVCELPDLGGSVAKFYPLFGFSDVPSAVMDFITSTLDSFPNVLDMVAGAGGGAALLGQTGSLNEPLCESIFGGEMTEVQQPPVTVIVDEDGNPVTTVTGTVAPSAAAAGQRFTSTLSSSSEGAGVTAAGESPRPSTREAAAAALPTAVPTPGGLPTAGVAPEN